MARPNRSSTAVERHLVTKLAEVHLGAYAESSFSPEYSSVFIFLKNALMCQNLVEKQELCCTRITNHAHLFGTYSKKTYIHLDLKKRVADLYMSFVK
jgi:hypothetical protein